ncbi:MAG TPA: hypothetical protein VEB86_17045 [Chryseosolibacter sp.]|nr:hypothetical protein [Chryseosolibacter sp.]
MKTRRTLLTVLFVQIALIAAAQNIKRVDANTANGAPYTSIQAAHDAATAGDTIHVVGAASGYAGATLTKRLVIIGPGYFLGENDDTQVNKSAARVTSAIRCSAGSSGTFIMGLHFDFTGSVIQIDGTVDNIVIKRNLLGGQVMLNYTNGINSNITIQQNYFSGNPVSNSYNYANNNVFLLNNYIGGYIEGLAGSYMQVTNNVINTSGTYAFYPSDPISGSLIKNNIIRVTGGSPTSNVGVSNDFRNNISNITAYDTTNNNQTGVDLATVFVADPVVVNPTPYSTDSRWQLKPGSPALNAGASGEDCGMFGGLDPYVLSGLPPIPAIYELTAPSTATQSGGLNVTIKAKSHQ